MEGVSKWGLLGDIYLYIEQFFTNSQDCHLQRFHIPEKARSIKKTARLQSAKSVVQGNWPWSCRFRKLFLDLRLDPPILNMLLFSINALAGGLMTDEVVAYVGLFSMAQKKIIPGPKVA